MTEYPPTLRAENVSVGYSKHEVISGLEVSVSRGHITTLIGPNGSGKSTLLKALGRIQPLARGTVHLDGADIHRMSTRDVARKLGLLPQSPLAPEGITVVDLVRRGRYPHGRSFGRGAAGDTDAVAEALELTGTASFAMRPVDSLSGGQRQRAWIAMVLAQTTPILLLDEPTTFLDIAHQIEVLELLRHLAHHEGLCVVIAIHDLNQALRFADQVAVLGAGRVIASGPPVSVLTPALLRDAYGVEARVERCSRGLPFLIVDSSAR